MVRRGICMNVVDGDTIDVLVEFGTDVYKYVRVRLAKVDCPETLHPKSPAEAALGQKAKAAVTELLRNQPVLVDLGAESQTQGRFVATVAFTRDGHAWEDLGQWLTDHKLLKSDVPPGVTP